MLHRDIRVHEICPNTSTSVWRFTSIFLFFFPQLSVQSVTHASSLPSSRDTHTVLSADGGTGDDREQKATMVMTFICSYQIYGQKMFYICSTALVNLQFRLVR